MMKLGKTMLSVVSALTLVAALAAPAAASCRYNCSQNNSGGGTAGFTGNVGSLNSAGAIGGLTKSMTSNWKSEEGAAGVDAGTGRPTSAFAKAKVATGGQGMSSALSFGFGPTNAETIVQGEMFGEVGAGFDLD